MEELVKRNKYANRLFITERIWAFILDLFIGHMASLFVVIPWALFVRPMIGDEDFYEAMPGVLIDLGTTIFIIFTFIAYRIIVPLYMDGATFGKKIFRFKIVQLNGEPLTFKTMLMRESVYILYVMTFFLLLLASGFMLYNRDDHRAVHDLIAGTKVVVEI